MREQLRNTLAAAPLERGVHILSRVEDLESIYLKVREKEGRLYTDEVVRRLPEVDPSHPLHREWSIRRSSAEKLAASLGGPLTLLDVGCGNGWMSNRLAGIAGCEVVGLDLNRPELEQAARVFSAPPRLQFACGDLFEDILPPRSFGAIVLAGSVQYFPDLRALLRRLLGFLENHGELHVIDSPFYGDRSVAKARERTRRYYAAMGFPEMAAHYHHHRYSDLREFRPAFLHDPRRLVQRLRRRFLDPGLSPFPWIRIARSAPASA